MENSTSQMKKKIEIQKSYIRERILHIFIGMIFFLIFSLGTVSVAFKNENGYWIQDAVCAGLEICLFALLWLFSKRLLRARNYYFVVEILFIPCVFGITIDIIRLVVLATNFLTLLVILIVLISLTIGCVLQASVIKKKLNQTMALNNASSPLNESTGEWDLTSKLKLEPYTAKKNKLSVQSIIGWITYFAPAIGVVLNRSLGAPRKFLVLGICLYIFDALFILLIAHNASILLYILEWERGTGKKIRIITKNPYV